jgi:5-methylthioadenosine/S-adenosylhomocysteine deaminase
MIAQFALQENLPLMMHAAESSAETSLLVNGDGAFADGLQARDIEWQVPHLTPIQYLQKHQILDTRPLLAHCINVDANDLEIIRQTGSGIAHCPRSNAKLGHGRAPLQAFLQHGIKVGLGSDSVASNNSCDLLAEARFALLSARASRSAAPGTMLTPDDGLRLLTTGGAEAMGKETAIGRLEAGYQADFVAVGLDGAHQIPSYDPVSTLIFSSSGSDVVTTVIGGKEVFTNGVVQTVDEVELRKRMTEVAHKLVS